MRRYFCAAIFVAASFPALAQMTPVDCGKASSPVAQAICAEPELRDLDRALARAFVAARGRVDSDALKALEKDQRAFLDERKVVLEKQGMTLADYLRHRIAFLDNLRSPAWGREATAFVGTWRNSMGEVRVAREESGQLVIAISTLSPVESAWICDIESQADAPKNGRVSFTEDEVKVTLSRRGSALIVGDQVPQGDGGRSFCGANGYIDGTYFKVQ